MLGIDADLETAEGVLEVYDELGTMLDTMADANATNNFVYDAITGVAHLLHITPTMAGGQPAI